MTDVELIVQLHARMLERTIQALGFDKPVVLVGSGQCPVIMRAAMIDALAPYLSGRLKQKPAEPPGQAGEQ